MENRNIKEISKNVYAFFIGFLICLVAISLTLNSGLIVKAVTFPFVYAFGVGSYIIYVLIFIQGIFVIIKKRALHIKFNKIFLLVLFVFLGLACLYTYYSCDQSSSFLSLSNGDTSINFIEKFNNVLTNIDNNGEIHDYFIRKPINLFGDSEFGCGILGYVLLSLGNLLTSSSLGGLILSFAFIAAGLLIVAIPGIISLIKFIATKKKTKKEKPAPKKIEKYESKKRIKNINVIKEAKNVDPDSYHSEVSGAGRNVEDKTAESSTEAKASDDFLLNPVFTEKSLDEPEEKTPEIEHYDGLTEPIFDIGTGFDDKFKSSEPEIVVSPKQEEHAEEKFDSIDEKEKIEEKIIVEKPVEQVLVSNQNIEPKIEQKVEVKETINESFVPKQEDIKIVEENTQNEEEPKPVKRPRVEWSPLSTDLLKTYDTSYAIELNSSKAEERKEIINQAFKDFNVGAEVIDYTIGPSITRYNIRYNPNVSQKSVANMISDISIRLNGVSARFESVIEGQSTSGLEIPNAEITTVAFKDVVEALPSNLVKHPLAVAFGKNIQGKVVYADYNEFPHMLISGTTGSGKSVFVNSLICTLIMRNSPDDLKLILVDPKKVEMSRYADMPHLLTPIIMEPSKVKTVLDKLVDEMERRYSLFAKNNATNIQEYNEDCAENGNDRMPYIIAVLDEYADLVDQCREISLPVVSLAQKARACGIHIMLCTQRPSTDVVTGIIKANIPTHVALMCASSTDSVTIIGEGGAEKLLGKGDMLVQSPLVSRVGVTRLQSCFIDRKEIIAIVNALKSKYKTYYDDEWVNLEAKKAAAEATGEYQESAESDEESRYQGIKEWVMTQEYMSMSKIQRECAVGFNRAGRFFTRLQKEGVVASESDSNKGCRVLIQDKFGEAMNS